MKLRTAELPNAYGASFGKVRRWNGTQHDYTKFHQGWDLEAVVGTPCFAIEDGAITHVGIHPQFGRNVLLQLADPSKPLTSQPGELFAFYAHLTSAIVLGGADREGRAAGGHHRLLGQCRRARAASALRDQDHVQPQPWFWASRADRPRPGAWLPLSGQFLIGRGRIIAWVWSRRRMF